MTTSFDDIALQQQRYTMDSEEASRQRAVLMAMVTGESELGRRRGRRRSMVIAMAAGTIALAGVGTAAALGVFSAPPSDRTVAYCYGSTDLSQGPANRFEFAVVDESGTGDAAVRGIEICSSYWRSGMLPAGPGQDPGGSGNGEPARPVPPLTACVMTTGQLAVFPGNPATCGELGLPVAQL